MTSELKFATEGAGGARQRCAACGRASSRSPRRAEWRRPSAPPGRRHHFRAIPSGCRGHDSDGVASQLLGAKFFQRRRPRQRRRRQREAASRLGGAARCRRPPRRNSPSGASRATLMRALEWAAASADEPRLTEAAADVRPAAGGRRRRCGRRVPPRRRGVDDVPAAQPRRSPPPPPRPPRRPTPTPCWPNRPPCSLTRSPRRRTPPVRGRRRAGLPRAAVAAPSGRCRACRRRPRSAPLASAGLGAGRVCRVADGRRRPRRVRSTCMQLLRRAAGARRAWTRRTAAARASVVDNVSCHAWRSLAPAARAVRRRAWLLRPSPQRALMAAGGEASSCRFFLQDHETFLQLAAVSS